MNVLDFEPKVRMCGVKRVRRTCFRARSQVARSSVCFVANAVREVLASLIGAHDVRAIEPRIPAPETWNALLAGAHAYAVRGSVTNAAFVVRPADALALALCAFGETEMQPPRELSAVEERVLDRVLMALVPALAPLCGQDVAPDRPRAAGAYASYFELTIEAARRVRLGVGLAAEPFAAPVPGGLTLDELGSAPVHITAELGHGTILTQALVDLRPGMVVPMTTKIGDPGTLRLGGAVLARGICGTSGSRYALVLE